MRKPTEKEMVDGIAQGIKDYLKFKQNTARLSDKPSSILERGVSNGIRGFLSEMSAGKYKDGRPLRIFGAVAGQAIDKFLGRNKRQIIEMIGATAKPSTPTAETKGSKCDQCDQPAIVPGACYAHVEPCSCGQPMHPDAMDCVQCYKDRQSNSALLAAAKSLVNSLPDYELDLAVESMSATNVSVIKHWRDKTSTAIAEAEAKEQKRMSKTVTINLTPEQIEQLRPLAQDLFDRFEETGKRVMFVGQVITTEDDEFDRVQFGLIPSDQSEEIERIRGLCRTN